jgi:hypothetical protein
MAAVSSNRTIDDAKVTSAESLRYKKAGDEFWKRSNGSL